MKIKFIALAFILFSGVSTFAQEGKALDLNNPNQASFSFTEEEYNFGTIKQGESVTHDFQFTNTGSEPLIINKAENCPGQATCFLPWLIRRPYTMGIWPNWLLNLLA